MALVVKDRVRETSTSTGTGSFILNGAVAGFQSFSVIGNANTTYYTIVDAVTGAWEVGIGTYTSATTTLSRDTVLESSTGGAKIDFAAGTKDVFVTYPAERSVYVEGSNIVPATAATLPVVSGGTGAGTLTGYVKGAGTSPLTASATIPNTDISGLGTMSTQNASSVAITGGTINNTPIGGTTPSTGSFTTVTADFVNAKFLVAQNVLSIGSFTWDSATTSPAAIAGGQPAPVVTAVHQQMRGCVLNANGTVNYYLDDTNWALKADGTASDLTGADGNVMVEIPKFYFRVLYVTTKPTWSISATPAAGFKVHPAFIKDGVEVDFRYYGAYDACVYDDSANAYISGTNLDNASSLVNTANDKLASVKGVYPMVGLTRNEFRLLAANNGTGWRQVDFALWSAVQMLYLIEYQTFNSQAVLGAGNTAGTYVASSANQSDSPHTIAGAGDSIANGSTNTTSGAGVNVKPGTSFMKYRGIENFYGNCWNWADGINVNVTAIGNVYVTNNRADFADNVSTNMTLIATAFPTTSGFIRDLLPADGYFLSSSNSGGSSTTYITDQHFAFTSSNRVVRVGGSANVGAGAGAFCLGSDVDSGYRNRSVGSRLAF